MPALTPACPLLFEHAQCGIGKGRHALHPALLGERVTVLARETAVDQRLLARIGQRHQRHAAESDVPPAAVDHEPLDPASRAGRLHIEIQSLAIAVSSGRGGAHEAGGQPFVWMASSGLRLATRPWRRFRAMHTPIV